MTDRQRLYTGRIITLEVEEATLPNGLQSRFEIIGHPGGAAVVPVDSDGRVCLLRQYRHVAQSWLWEVPAGKLDGRPAEVTARLELAEEAGLEAGHLDSLGTLWTSPGLYTEVVHLYLATALRAVAARPEPDEVLEIHWIPLQDALRAALEGTYTDAKTVVALVRAADRLGIRR